MTLDDIETVRKWCAENRAPAIRTASMAWPVSKENMGETVRLVREAGWNCPEPKPDESLDHAIVSFT